LSLIIALFLIKQETFSLVWLSVAIFFAVFSIPAFLFLPKDESKRASVLITAVQGFKDTLQTFKSVVINKEQRKFLLAYFIYEDGVNTVIVFSSIFAATTLGFKTAELIILYLIVQVTALIGAFVMSKPIDTLGPKKVVIISLLLWSCVSFLTYFVHTKTFFLIIASIAGLGLGTIQAASRAFFTQFIPNGKESEYFGLYALTGKTSAILGPLLFGTMSSLHGSQRPAVLSVALFFIIGLLIVSMVKGGYSNIKNSHKA
ncbi:MAG: MFS transporter, partial [Thermodesulfovibrionales bacterium]|nr:MFS transporter [Thermodesulfovibrionales bacterium]